MLRLGLICGGPSLERGISLNSARCVFDHLKSYEIDIHLIYVDRLLNFYLISEAQLYSNTPSDFDFKLKHIARCLDQSHLVAYLKNLDLVFPCIHGAFGETGELQRLLEDMHVPFIGSSSEACQQLFFKHQATEVLMRHGFGTLPVALLKKCENNHLEIIQRFFKTHQLTRAIVKPSAGGSSIGVYSVSKPHEALEKVQLLFSQGIDTEVLLEPFVSGREFTVLVFERHGQPVALIPTEIEVSYENHGFLDYRRKYLPTANTFYHTPPRFDSNLINLIQTEAENIFKLFGMRDVGRIDGWILPDNRLLFTDINPVSGMEQNSFLFRQTSILGLSHAATLGSIVESACQRYGLNSPVLLENNQAYKNPVYVLFGGQTAERQVSLMSGTNVWLKLQHSKDYNAQPFFWDNQGFIWQIPYSIALNHTTEEVFENCTQAKDLKLVVSQMIDLIKKRWGHTQISFVVEELPEPFTLDVFLKKAKKAGAFLFIALHGGGGENGELQQKLEQYGIPHNGSRALASKLCMDKYETGLTIQKASYESLETLPKIRFHLDDLLKKRFEIWNILKEKFNTRTIIIKPQHDGCSAGIVKLESEEDLLRYLDYATASASFIPAGVFKGQVQPIEMPPSTYTDYLFEPYVQVDMISTENGKLVQNDGEGWIEMTVGVLEKKGKYHALSPSITIAEGAILSLEEKFQGGTGVNLTPPPNEVLEAQAITHVRQLIEKAAEILGIENYARLDIFYNRKMRQLILIEANTLPGLTPSTVIYHQAFAENPSLNPLAFLEKIIDNVLSN